MNIFSLIFLFSFAKNKHEVYKNSMGNSIMDNEYNKIEDISNPIDTSLVVNIENQIENKSITKNVFRHLHNNASIYGALFVTVGFTWLNSYLKIYKIKN